MAGKKLDGLRGTFYTVSAIIGQLELSSLSGLLSIDAQIEEGFFFKYVTSGAEIFDG